MKKPSLRRIALNALIEVTDNGAYANLALKEAVKNLDSADSKWVGALLYNTLDNLIYIDKAIEANTKSKLDKKIKAVLRLGVCQLLFMSTPESAAVNETVKLVKEIGKSALSGFVNAVMRAIAAKKDEPFKMPNNEREVISIKYSIPKYLADMYVDEYGLEFTEKMFSYKQKGMNFRLVKPFCNDQELPGEFQETIYKNARSCEQGFDVTENELFKSGKITVQSLSSMTVCHVLDAKKSMRVLDACAAPGGKSAYISEMMQNTGEIVAGELHQHRIELTKKTFERLGVKNAVCICNDAAKFDPQFKEAFDAVLVDAPCSGLGVTNKSDIKYTKSIKAIQDLAELQYSILKNCAKYVKVGGTLVYSTCTISKKENEENALRFLKENPNFKADTSIASLLPDKMADRAKDGMIQIFPHIDFMEGFFIARFTRWT